MLEIARKMDLLTLLTTAARTSYPWPLCGGNALWAVIAYKAANNKKDKPGRIFAASRATACHRSARPRLSA
mgnify:CR=1 FL=1